MPQELNLSLPDAPLSLAVLLLNLAVGVILALGLRVHFWMFGSTRSNPEEFAQVFPFILLTTILIITAVSSSLALSLGLVGALSILRFRTPIKEREEFAYLFIAIAMGLGLGANQTVPTISVAGDGWLPFRMYYGPELTAEAFVDWCRRKDIELRYIQPGKPDQNAYIERFNRSCREEVLSAYVFESIEQVQLLTDEWLKIYNEERPHHRLGRVPPLTFMPRPDRPVESGYRGST